MKAEYLTEEILAEFMEWMKDEFPSSMSNLFARDLVENIVRYAYKERGHSSWWAIDMIADLIPEVEYEELEARLTKFGFREESDGNETTD